MAEGSENQKKNSKNIVLFADGTGNSSSSPQKTNVWRTYKALDIGTCEKGLESDDVKGRASDGKLGEDKKNVKKQIAFYDNGVGTSSFQPWAILGQVFGIGLAHNVKQIYRFLCKNYTLGDSIYAFGFSRGAFTIRVLVGLISSQGIIDSKNIDDIKLDEEIEEAYRSFRKEGLTGSLLPFLWNSGGDFLRWCKGKKPVEKTIKDKRGRKVRFVGLWDTVDAYGSPIDELTGAWDMVVYPLTGADRNLSKHVERACHALALDEQRLSFEPMLWNEEPGGNSRDKNQVYQVWFAGVHSNLGGGYPDDSLSFVPLNWMLDQAELAGLTFLEKDRKKYRTYENLNGPLYDSRAGMGNLYRYAPRSLDKLCDDSKPNLVTWILGWIGVKNELKGRKISKVLGWFGVEKLQYNEVKIKTPKIHHSVFKRIESKVCSYAPIGLPEGYEVVGDVPLDALKPTKPAKTSVPVIVTSPETKKRSESRCERQTFVWNKVWARKLTYYLMFVWLLLFIFYPRYVEMFEGWDFWRPHWPWLLEGIVWIFELILAVAGNLFQFIPKIIGLVPGLGIAEEWVQSFSLYPIAFLVFVGGLSGFVWLGRKWNTKLSNEMNRVWSDVLAETEVTAEPVSDFRKKVAGVLNDQITKKIYKNISKLLELVAAVFLLLFLLSVTAHVVGMAIDGGGGVCGAGNPESNVEFGQPFEFEAKQYCYNTGLKLKKNHVYHVRFSVAGGDCEGKKDQKTWCDKTIPANANGWEYTPWKTYFVLPLRRHWFIEWYRPVVRIGHTFFDIYPLQSDRTKPENKNVLVMNLEVKRSGNMYLYLNDAVIFTPKFWMEFYGNNNGKAEVTVTDVTPKNRTRGGN